MREVVGKAARVKHIVGKTLLLCVSSLRSLCNHDDEARPTRCMGVHSGWGGTCAHENAQIG